LFIILGSTAKNFWMVVVLVGSVVILGYIFFRYNYSFATLKQKIRLKKKLDEIGIKQDKQKTHSISGKDSE